MQNALKTIEEGNLYSRFCLVEDLSENEMMDVDGGWCIQGNTINVGHGNTSDNFGGGCSCGSGNSGGSSGSGKSSSASRGGSSSSSSGKSSRGGS